MLFFHLRRNAFLFALIIAAVVAFPAAARSSSPSDRLTQQIDELLAKAYPFDEPGAAVLVKRGDKIILRKGYGLANVELGIPVDPETIFNVGSITKQFTAVAILRLVQEGKLALDDPVARFFPNPSPFLRQVTIEHLLTHTSGIKNYTALPDYGDWNRFDLKPAQILERLRHEPLDFNPGERCSYNDSGFFLLGMIIEKLYGRRYQEVIQEKIFDRLGMKHSACDGSGRAIPHRAVGYVVGKQTRVRARYLSPTVAFAAGAAVSNVDDLARWNLSLNGAACLLRRDLLDRMFTPYRLMNGRSIFYGYAWAINRYRGHVFVEHGGRFTGFDAHVLRVPDANILIIILSNSMDRVPGPGYLARVVATYLLGNPFMPVIVRLAPEISQEYVGIYVSEDTDRRFVVASGDQLYSCRSGDVLRKLLAIGHDEFVYENSTASVRFERSRNGTVKSMVLEPEYGEQIASEKVASLSIKSQLVVLREGRCSTPR
jgi:CubicO group peptidase (beta-lactamase class C family)